ncbi:hypothetical protein [Vibrio sp. ER1A]|uniref:hypothetical protein n=1 Tax=Vibrio sp. ER1A TaxID=1517681 RepID=UPI0004DD273B|nr:hypothetical protein [Vibrio sp. ER1A]KFA99269.1 hypothetical protein HW45_04820 [Vibrio sp. ER1A]
MSHVSINLTANTANYIQRLKDAKTQTDRNIIMMERRIDDFAKDVNKNFTSVNGAIDTMLNSLSKVKGGGYIAALGAMGIAIASVTSSIHQFNVQAIENEKVLEKAANRARMATDDFLSFARVTNTVGIDIEKLSDISKDVFDRIGDYATTGGGPLKDFFDVVGEGKVKLKDLENLNSIEVIQKIASEMEAAGASGAQMTFVLESIASDLSDMKPLLDNGSEGFKKLQERMDQISKQPVISTEAKNEVAVMDAAFDAMWHNFGVMGTEKMDWLYKALGKAANMAAGLFGEEAVEDRKLAIMREYNKTGNNTLGDTSSLGSISNERIAIQAAIKEQEFAIRSSTRQNVHAEKHVKILKEQLEVLDKIEESRLSVEKASSGTAVTKDLFDKTSKVTGTDNKSLGKELEDVIKLQAMAKDTIAQSEIEIAELKEQIANETSKVLIDQLNVELDQKEKALIKEQNLYKLHGERIAGIHTKNAELKKKADEQAAQEKASKEAEDKRNEDLRLQGILNNLQHEVSSSITANERINAQYDLDQERYTQMLNAKKISQEQFDDYMFSARMNKNMGLAELDNQFIMNDFIRQMETAEAEQEFLTQEYENKAISKEQFDARMLQSEANYTQAKHALIGQQLGMMNNVLSGMSNLAEEGSKEQKALFALEKSAAIAQMGLNMYTGWSAIDKDPSLPTAMSKNIAKGALVVQYGAMMGQAAAVTLGQFHSGTDEVDQTGSYVLKKGERIVQEEANKDLTSYLKANSSGGNQPITVNAPLNVQGDANIDENKFKALLVQHRESVTHAVKMAQRETPSLR